MRMTPVNKAISMLYTDNFYCTQHLKPDSALPIDLQTYLFIFIIPRRIRNLEEFEWSCFFFRLLFFKRAV